jgi:hypothetical protein
MPSRRTTILAEADLLDRLDRYARHERMTKTAVISTALEAWLDAHEAPGELPFVAIGRSSSGRLSLDGRSIARRELGRRDAPRRG